MDAARRHYDRLRARRRDGPMPTVLMPQEALIAIVRGLPLRRTRWFDLGVSSQ
jgi:hypothetical protein